MLQEYCSVCGNLESNHQANQTENERYYSIVKEIISSVSQEQANVLDQILYDWRTHTLPECDPLSVS